MKNKICTVFFSLIVSFSWAQFDLYKYTSKIQKPNSTWHKILLEESVLGRTEDDLSDIRIIQVRGKDTLEAPYLINKEHELSTILNEVQHSKFDIFTDKEEKKTYISVSFKYKIPLSKIKLTVENEFDYYRQMSIFGSTDSLSPQNFEDAELIFSGYLNSVDSSDFDFDERYAKNLLLIIENKDNLPLKIKNLVAFFKPISLTARFNDSGDYFLCYGNSQADFPEYDINYFQNRIPEKLSALTYEILETEISPEETKKIKVDSTPIWLWLVVSGIVIVLLIFTLRMMKTKS